MTKEEAIKWIDDRMCFGRGTFTEHHPLNIDECWQAGMMAIEALSAEPNCQKCAIKELWKETEKEDMVSVVRCKDCRHHEMRDCPVWGDDTTDDYMWCYYGERREL